MIMKVFLVNLNVLKYSLIMSLYIYNYIVNLDCLVATKIKSNGFIFLEKDKEKWLLLLI